MRTDRAPIAWVLEQGEYDYSPARVYATQIQRVLADRLTPNADADWHQRTIQQMRRAFADYIPGVDYVIPTGQPVRMMLAAMVMKERGDLHNLLGWDPKQGRYMLYTLDLRAAPNPLKDVRTRDRTL